MTEKNKEGKDEECFTQIIPSKNVSSESVSESLIDELKTSDQFFLFDSKPDL